MAGLYQAPPPPPGSDFQSAAWQSWIQNLSASLRTGQTISWANIDFTVSNILSVATRNHSDLQNLQGGSSSELYHLTYAQYIAATSGKVSGLLATVVIPASVTPSSCGLNFPLQTANATLCWRVRAHGLFTAASSVTGRSLIIAATWGSTALPGLIIPVQVSVSQTTTWELEFIITASSAAAAWVTGWMLGSIPSGTLNLLAIVPASSAIPTGNQTLGLQASISAVVVGDSLSVQNVTMERLK